jgi:protease stability complex PrcB-like protein
MTAPFAVIAMLVMMLQAPADMRTLDKGVASNVDAARQATARTVGEWETLWRLHGGERTRPAVDFSKEFVVAVFLGSRPTAGFAVEIVGTREDAAALMVQYRETRPPADRIVAQVLTMPYHIVAVRHAAVADVKFEKIK